MGTANSQTCDHERLGAGDKAHDAVQAANALRARAWRTTLLTSTMLAGLGMLRMPLAMANPSDGQVVGGSATITQAPGTTTINQNSNRAVIDWKSFSIAGGETMRFNQPGRDAIALNRVRGGEMSNIQGRLQANGNVWLVNPNGVLIGPHAQVDTGGFLATTADIPNDDFMAGRYRFSIPSPNPNAGVVNEGTISVAEGGLAGLVAPHARNAGVIEGTLSEVVVAGVPTFALDFRGDGLIGFEATSAVTEVADRSEALVTNAGTIAADGGHVLLTTNTAADVVDNAINMTGVIAAQTVAQKDGTIVLDGGPQGAVTVAGRLDATGAEAGEHGGNIDVLGQNIRIADASLDASGSAGGGAIHVGGDARGEGERRRAEKVIIEPAATIRADALDRGDGGTVVAWADKALWFGGRISAAGGPNGGNGGFIETSSGGGFVINGSINAGAANGTPGTWLLDPENVDIRFLDEGEEGVELPVTLEDFVGEDVVVTPGTIAAAEAAIAIQADNDINVLAAVDATESITLDAGNNVNVLAAVDATESITLDAGNNVNVSAEVNSTQPITLEAGNDINVSDTLASEASITLTAGNNVVVVAIPPAPEFPVLGSIAAGTDLAITATNDIILNGAIEAGGTATLTAQNITANTILDAGGEIFSAGSVSAGELALIANAPGGAASLPNFNQVGTIAIGPAGGAGGSFATVNFQNDSDDSLTIGTVGAIVGATADSIVLGNVGSILQDGDSPVIANELSLIGGEGGEITFPAQNQVNTLFVAGGGGTAVTFVNAQDLQAAALGDADNSIAGATSVDLTVNGRLIVDAPIVTNGGGNAIVIRATAFTNNVGETGLQTPGEDGRFLVYSTNPADDTRGIAVDNDITFKRYNSTPDNFPPGDVPADANYFLYAIAPEIQVIADDKARPYGDPNPALTSTIVAGLIDGDTLADAFDGTITLTTPATPASPVLTNGTTYAINVDVEGPVEGDISPLNYTVVAVDGNLTVQPALITAQANDASRPFGEANPPFSAMFDLTDFKLGQLPADLGAILFATNATQSSPAGAYSIDVTGFSNPNYQLDPASLPGTLTITPVATAEQDVPPIVTNPTIPSDPAQVVSPTTVDIAVLTPTADRQSDEALLFSNDGNNQLWGLIPTPIGQSQQ